MKYEHQRELVEGLRAMADFIEQNIELPIEYEPVMKLNVWLHDDTRYSDVQNPLTAREKLAKAAKVLGKAEKIHAGTYFDLIKKFSECVRIEYTIDREAVCKRVVVGTKVVPASYVERPERTEEIVEWVCDEPILTA